ncbi:MAG: type II secretion system protein, partial [Acidobacteriota bacterium]
MRRTRERGFALLLVFAMAAAVAILLYTEMPRVVFEGQRLREQTLIDRGEQYQRAIQLYVRKIQRYPARIEDLESTNNIRFLRRRYTDPMTGKDDWRLIHVGPGGILMDSKVQKLQPSDKDKEKKSENTFITEAAAVGSTGVGQPGAGVPSPGLVRRASDRAPVSAASMPGSQGGGAGPVDPDGPQQFSPGYATAPP